jgi:hypothetical protein
MIPEAERATDCPSANPVDGVAVSEPAARPYGIGSMSVEKPRMVREIPHPASRQGAAVEVVLGAGGKEQSLRGGDGGVDRAVGGHGLGGWG